MASTILLSDNGVSSGSAGLKSTAGNDGVLILQTTTSGGTATNAVYINTSQNVGMGVTPSTSTVKAFEIGYAGNALLGWGANDVGLSCGVYYNGGWKYAATNSLGASHYEQYNGAHYWAGVAPTAHTVGDTPAFTTNMVLNATGALALKGASTSATGVGITFPATQSASTDANTLDDYEEGTWTPVLNRVGTAPSVTYSRQVGTYIKIGKFVYINCEIQITAVASQGASYNCVTGFPFPVSNTNASWYDMGGSVKYNTIFATIAVDRASGGGGQGSIGTSFLQANTNGTSEVNVNYQAGYLTFTAVYQATA